MLSSLLSADPLIQPSGGAQGPSMSIYGINEQIVIIRLMWPLYTFSHIYSMLLYINGSTPYALYTGFFSFYFIIHLRGLPLTLYLDLLHAFSLLTRCTVIIRPLPYWQAFSFLPFLTISSLAPAQAVGTWTPKKDIWDGLTEWRGSSFLSHFLKTWIFLKLDWGEILFLGSGRECQP